LRLPRKLAKDRTGPDFKTLEARQGEEERQERQERQRKWQEEKKVGQRRFEECLQSRGVGRGWKVDQQERGGRRKLSGWDEWGSLAIRWKQRFWRW
jgi:hypothetical protein